MPRSTYTSKDAVQFGAIVRRLRTERGWTLVKLAQRTGMHRTYLGVLEKGGNVPTLNTILEFAEVFNVEAADIVREVQEARRAALRKNAAPSS